VDLNDNHDPCDRPPGRGGARRRAKVIHAEGELQGLAELLEAAQMLAKQPEASSALLCRPSRRSQATARRRSCFRCPWICSPPGVADRSGREAVIGER